MIDLKILRQMIKDTIDREQTVDILTLSSYEVERNFKFSIREERTPSASIRQDGLITDFGDDWSGDIVALLHEKKGLSLKEATLYVCDQMGIPTEADSTMEYRPLPIKRKPRLPTELTAERYKEIITDISRFDSSDKQTFKDDGYKQSALSIAPMWVYSEANETDLGLFREFTTYDEVERSIVLKLHDYTGKIISYKHRYKRSIKWCSAKDTHPNKQCMVSIPKSSQYSPVFIVEGAHDFLMMVLLGLNVVAIPTVNYTEWTQNELSILTGRKVTLIPDLDPEFKGVNCMKILAEQITEAKSIKIGNVVKILDFIGMRHNDPKMDFSDVVNLWTRGRDEFVSTLSHLTFIRKTA